VKLRFCLLTLLLGTMISSARGARLYWPNPLSTASGEKNASDLVEFDTTYTFESSFHDSRLGRGSSLYNDVSYDHRFRVQGNWYLRVGVEYERFDFGGSDNGLPDHLQAIFGHLAYEYVVRDRAAAGIRLHPGFYFQNRISGDAFDIPFKLFAGFPLKKDKLFAFIGVGGGIYQNPVVGPGGGIVWLISDKMRLEGVFPKPAFVYNPSESWQFRIYGDLLYETFRTDDVVTPKFELHNAVLEYSEWRAGLQASYSGFEAFKINFGAGWTIRRSFDFYRADRREKVEPAPFLRLAVEGKF
jgi:hypothetical protein